MKHFRLLAIAMLAAGAPVLSLAPVSAQARPAGARTARPASAITSVAHISRAFLRDGVRPLKPPRVSDRVPAVLRRLGPDDNVYTCDDGINVLSAANGLYVSAELGYTGNNYAMLRARASSAGPYESWDFCDDITYGYWFLISDANGRIVSAELGYTGNDYAMLRARSTSIGPWEQWFVGCDSNNDMVLYSDANDNYTAAELGYTGNNYAEMRARSSSIGPWEEFNSVNSSLSC